MRMVQSQDQVGAVGLFLPFTTNHQPIQIYGFMSQLEEEKAYYVSRWGVKGKSSFH